MSIYIDDFEDDYEEIDENELESHNNIIMTGWQCPLCHVVYSPFVRFCENPHYGYKIVNGIYYEGSLV